MTYNGHNADVQFVPKQLWIALVLFEEHPIPLFPYR